MPCFSSKQEIKQSKRVAVGWGATCSLLVVVQVSCSGQTSLCLGTADR